ncbi:DNA internalization-related competence protein ComEC/Rec2 [Pseudidiomarina sediminum]|uniref:DNA internalization-related competence protein ComEC/Rec2 n=1 Tax=Pseudidiomarina sediminum TaxID=431675 RepID=UPI001FD4885C|nr:DNA internalization-related competence protein ComEC/Rec2 [Pseudidiomarina sediminum]
MDRWLCVFLAGYGLSFAFHHVASLSQLVIFALLAVVCVALSTRTHLRTALLGALLCGILWGAGNAYFAFTTQVRPETQAADAEITLTLTTVVTRANGAWRITGKVHRDPSQPELPAQVRLHWYDPHAIAPQRMPLQGEQWRFVVRLRSPQGTRNQGSGAYHRYLLSAGIDAIGTIRSGHFVAGQASLRQHFVTQLQRATINHPLAGVAQALVVGERQQLSASQWQVVQRTGLAHLLAISGMHLTLVVGFMLAVGWSLAVLSVRQRSRRERHNVWRWLPWLMLPVALLYAWLAGFAIATVRALVMLLVIGLHKQLGWRVSPMRVLLRAVVVVVCLDPFAPLSLGFWLSVGAVATILLMHWRWRRYHGKWALLREWWRFEWLMALLFVPVMAAAFGGVPTAAALTNLVVVPLISFWVLPGCLLAFAAASLGGLAVAELLFDVALSPLTLLWPLLSWLAEQPWQWLPAEDLPSWPWLAVLVGMFLAPVRHFWRAVGAAVVVLSYLVHSAVPPRAQLLFHVLDVEQGAALVVERQGHALLIDTGVAWEQGRGMADRVITPFLQARRLQPEVAFVTHTDRDHQGGVASLQRAYPHVRWWGGETGAPCLAGQYGYWRGVSWQVLHPRDAQARGNRSNNHSCVILIRYGQFQVLVTGDIETAAERRLLAELAPVAATVLVVPHHGSKSSSEGYFIRHVQPSLAVLMRGRHNSYRHPHPDVTARYQKLRIPLLDTAQGGQISIATDGRQWHAAQPFAAENGFWFDADPYKK